MKIYTEAQPPKAGRALAVWRAFRAYGYSRIDDLHYNATLWGHASPTTGWGCWACEGGADGRHTASLAIRSGDLLYIYQTAFPYRPVQVCSLRHQKETP